MGLLAPAPGASGPRVPAFVPIVAEAIAPEVAEDIAPAPPSAPAIEVESAGAVVRVRAGVDADLLAAVLRAVRASASPA